MMLKDIITEFVYECEIRNYTLKTIKGYKNNILHLANFLEREFKAKLLEEVTLPMIKSFLIYVNYKYIKTQRKFVSNLIILYLVMLLNVFICNFIDYTFWGISTGLFYKPVDLNFFLAKLILLISLSVVTILWGIVLIKITYNTNLILKLNNNHVLYY